MARAAIVAAVVTLVTALAHAAGGGAFPSPLLLAGAATWSLWCAFLVGGRRSTLVGTVLAVALSQPAMHLVLSLGDVTVASSGGAGGGLSGGAGGAHHHHDASLVLATATSTSGGHDHGSMLVAHVVAGLVSIGVLRWGSALLTAVTRLVTTLLLRLVPACAPSTPARHHPLRASWVADALPTPAFDRSSVRWRGPPSLVAAR